MQAGYLAHRVATPSRDNQSIRQLKEKQLRSALAWAAHALDLPPPDRGLLAMAKQNFNAPVANGTDTERLVAEYRDKIIKLEAHGMPGESGALWDALEDILADIKRHQPVTNPNPEGSPHA